MNILHAKCALNTTKNNRYASNSNTLNSAKESDRYNDKYSKGFLYCMEVINTAVECLNYNVTIRYSDTDIVTKENADDIANELESLGYYAMALDNELSISWAEDVFDSWFNVKTV